MIWSHDMVIPNWVRTIHGLIDPFRIEQFCGPSLLPPGKSVLVRRCVLPSAEFRRKCLATLVPSWQNLCRYKPQPRQLRSIRLSLLIAFQLGSSMALIVDVEIFFGSATLCNYRASWGGPAAAANVTRFGITDLYVRYLLSHCQQAHSMKISWYMQSSPQCYQ